ncbi:hypothetical protein [Parabacteroides sp. FAFU027]|uniref:hypothetical protein n=1 Tax=Parabacteroides sp. FAFU027 TaxID=2922715 RepID=UPI001FAFA46D|nr:hypothetical protein [Parabacteroides sp. FAFU027]
MKCVKWIFLVMLISFPAIMQGQTKDEKLSELKEILKRSLYQSDVQIDKQGIINRSDNNGNRFRYSLEDIREVSSDFDGFHNLLISMKEEKSVQPIVNGQESELKMNVFSFANQEDCEKAKGILNELIQMK